jgi:hypothetical protein
MQPHGNTSPFATQSEEIENLLRSRYGRFVPCYELAAIALQYCARINSIRKKLLAAGDRERIENKTERVNGKRHGSYRIALTADVLGIAKPTPSKSWDEIVSERDRKLNQRESGPELVLTP